MVSVVFLAKLLEHRRFWDEGAFLFSDLIIQHITTNESEIFWKRLSVRDIGAFLRATWGKTNENGPFLGDVFAI